MPPYPVFKIRLSISHFRFHFLIFPFLAVQGVVFDDGKVIVIYMLVAGLLAGTYFR